MRSPLSPPENLTHEQRFTPLSILSGNDDAPRAQRLDALPAGQPTLPLRWLLPAVSAFPRLDPAALGAAWSRV